MVVASGGQGPRVFLSYAAADRAVATLVAERLRESGWFVWSAEDAIQPGDRLVTAVHRALRESDVVVQFLSKGSEASSWMQLETAAAIASAEADSRKHFLPVVIDSSVQPGAILQDYRWIEADTSSPDELAARVDDALRHLRVLETTATERRQVEDWVQTARDDLARSREHQRRLELRRRRLATLYLGLALVMSLAVVAVAIAASGRIDTSLVAVITGPLFALGGAVIGWSAGTRSRGNDA